MNSTGALTKTLAACGGIEELIINGPDVPDEQFQKLISKGCSIATKRLGVASSDLQASDLLGIIRIYYPNQLCARGYDLGGVTISVTWLSSSPRSLHKHLFSSSRSVPCHLKNAAELGAIFEAHHQNSKLRFLVLSFNPDLFPKIFGQHRPTDLPDHRDMWSIHLDYNGLRSKDIIRLADSFAKCPSLQPHFAAWKIGEINAAAGEALAVAVKLSQTITFVGYWLGLDSRKYLTPIVTLLYV